ncbi:MAG: T9SS type A sorting domain-containing protein, partial [Chitinophagales bacterium]
IIFVVDCSLFVCAQPAIAWQNVIGGTNNDVANSLIKTFDGGYLVGGYSFSGFSGDKTEDSEGSSDYWITKIDMHGILVWEKSYGGSGYDILQKVVQTIDSGYILGGYTQSPVSGDITKGAYGGLNDYWVLKIDSIGNIQWQNTIGGSDYDYLTSIETTSDGGCIIGGYSYSGVSGEKTEPAISFSVDYWIVKLNATGNIDWQNTIGGSGFDVCYQASQTPDHGYLVFGYSTSGVSGDKTSPLYGAYAASDIWILKLDSLGTILWQKNIGGNSTEGIPCAVITASGGAVVGCSSSSGISGDKTEARINPGSFTLDHWVFEIDASGNILWQNTIGGLETESIYSISVDSNGEIAIGGGSESGIGGDKTEINYGITDYWVLKLDSIGNILWQKTTGGSALDFCYSLVTNDYGGIVVAGYSSSSISGNKTEASIAGSNDYWIVQIDAPCTPVSEICNGIDDDCNGLPDDGIIETISISAGGPITFCQGGSVILSATYTGTTVQWYKDGVIISGATSSSYTANAKATYTCISMSDCDTVTSSGIFVDVLKKPKAVITAGGPTSFCAGSSVTLSVLPVPGSTYQWYNGATLISGETGLSYIATTAGNFKCLVTKTATGCYKNSNGILVVVSCKEGIENELLKLYPNPVSDIAFIQTTTDLQNAQLHIYNMIGEEVIILNNINGNNIRISAKYLTAGNYVFQIIENNGWIGIGKFFVE